VLFARQGARIFGVDNRRQTVRFGPEVAFAQIGIIGFDRQIELEALRLYGLPEDAPPVLSGCPALPTGGRTLMFSASWDLPSMPPGATTNADVTVVGARRGILRVLRSIPPALPLYWIAMPRRMTRCASQRGM